jgi:raffinose/stachyose/melibiose transport system substrate-binding protein
MSTSVRSRFVLVLLSALLSVALATGCAPGVPAPAAPPGAAAPAPAAEKVMLEFWMNGEPGEVNELTQLIDEFMKLNPEIEVKTSFMGTELVPPALLPALNAGTGPDIFGAGTGPGQPAAIIAAGHALDLTPFYFDYGWDKIIPPTVVNYTSSDGKLWAVGDSVETTLMFYNKAIFAEHNLSVPTTWAELLATADALKAAGFETVIGLGGLDKWPISHWQSLLWGAHAGPEGIDRVMFGDGRWDDPVFVEATDTLLKLHQAGYFGPNPLAIGYQDAITKFWRGETPMYFTGSWVIADAVRDLGDKISDFSVFAVPSPVEGKPIYVAEDIGSGWYVNAKTKHPREAGELLNFLFFRPESRKILLEAGHVPVGPLDVEGVNIPELLKEVFTVSNTYRGNGTIHAFLDTVMPGNVTEVTYDGLQALLAGQMTSEQFCQAVQAAWEEAKAEGAILKPGGVIRP